MVKIAIAAGGSGGHIIPAIAMGNVLSDQGAKVLYFAGKGGMEEKIYANHKLDFRSISIRKIYRADQIQALSRLTNLLLPFSLCAAVYKSLSILSEFKPESVVGAGGSVSGPVLIAALLKRIPIYLQEPNSYPGLTNRKLARFCSQIFLGMEIAEKYLPSAKCLLTGIPTNLSDKLQQPPQSLDFNLQSNTKKLLILGGSQGSQSVNNTLRPIIKDILALGIEIIWQAGEKNIEALKAEFPSTKGLHMFGFTDKLSEMYRIADFAIARAGAISIAELEIARIPAILIPLPWAAENHQFFNAREASNAKKAVLLEQKNMTPESLLNAIETLRTNYSTMAMSFSNSIHAKAAEKIAQTILINTRGI